VVGSDGTVSFAPLLAGPYRIAVEDSMLASIAWSMPLAKPMPVRESAVMQASIVIPSIREYVHAQCIATEIDAPEDGIAILGRVLDSKSRPLNYVDLRFALKSGEEDPEPVRLQMRTGLDGMFHLCLPRTTRGDSLIISATRARTPIATVQYLLNADVLVLPVRASR
jgi:hypothetical protein